MPDEELVTVYQAMDEVTANIVKNALEDAGIHAMIKSHQVPWYDGIFTAAEGCWGEVMVRPEDAERAISLLEEYTGGDE